VCTPDALSKVCAGGLYAQQCNSVLLFVSTVSAAMCTTQSAICKHSERCHVHNTVCHVHNTVCHVHSTVCHVHNTVCHVHSTVCHVHNTVCRAAQPAQPAHSSQPQPATAMQLAHTKQAHCLPPTVGRQQLRPQHALMTYVSPPFSHTCTLLH
jgi:hypothetical protein